MSTIYVHWPFCVSKCHYCDFNSVACNEKIDFEDWLSLYKKVLLAFKNQFYKGEKITSVYFGGGTPSLLPVSFVDEFLNEVSKNFDLQVDAEITLEANPKTINAKKAEGLKKAGVNRLSIGVQSLNDEDLKMLGRIHSAKDAIDCVNEMRLVFDNLSIDLIYNRPKHKVEDWKTELEAALKLPITHVSLYELIVENGTPLKTMIESGVLEEPSCDDEFIKQTVATAESFGFMQYEVSNFAKDAFQGRHNLSYWKYEDYFGIGPGAHSRVSVDGKKIAIAQVSVNKDWLLWASKAAFSEEILSEDDVFKERLIMGLRSHCGFDTTTTSVSLKNKYDLDNKIATLLKNSYMIIDEGKIILTYEGILRLNLVVEYIVKI